MEAHGVQVRAAGITLKARSFSIIQVKIQALRGSLGNLADSKLWFYH